MTLFQALVCLAFTGFLHNTLDNKIGGMDGRIGQRISDLEERVNKLFGQMVEHDFDEPDLNDIESSIKANKNKIKDCCENGVDNRDTIKRVKEKVNKHKDKIERNERKGQQNMMDISDIKDDVGQKMTAISNNTASIRATCQNVRSFHR